MTRSLAISIMRAAEKVREYQRKESETERALRTVRRQRERAEAKYLALLPRRSEAAAEPSTN